jgi:hypothetical protein
MDTDWQQIIKRNLAAATPPSTCSETQWEGDLPPRPKATRGHRQAIAELGLRFRPAATEEHEAHAFRLELLAVDCADLAPGLLRMACDVVAREARFLPSAAELRAAAQRIVEERQRVRDAAAYQATGQPMPVAGDKAAAYARANRMARDKGWRVMQAPDGELFKLGDFGERRGIRGDGSAIVPFFRREGEVDGVPPGWWCRQEDAAALAQCYREYDAEFALQGCLIVERGA